MEAIYKETTAKVSAVLNPALYRERPDPRDLYIERAKAAIKKVASLAARGLQLPPAAEEIYDCLDEIATAVDPNYGMKIDTAKAPEGKWPTREELETLAAPYLNRSLGFMYFLDDLFAPQASGVTAPREGES